MNKGNAIALGMMSLAIIGLAIWNVQLSGQLDKRELAVGDVDDSGGREALVDQNKLKQWEARLEAVEKKATGLKDDFSSFRTNTDSAIAKLAGGEVPEIETGGVAAAPSAELEKTVEAILEEREEKARQERQAERVRRMAGWVLRGVEATPEQQTAVGEILMSYWDARQKSDAELRERDATPEDRAAARETLQADRDLRLQQTLDAAQYAKVSETLNQIGRMDRGGRGGGNRGGNRGR